MTEFDFVILTDDHFIKPATDAFMEAGWEEDRLIMEALKAQGFRVTRKSWADRHFDWSSTRAAIFRTTWDYFNRFDEWKRWLQEVSTQTRLINDYELALWNMDKHYLAELQKAGINIPETLYIEPGEKTDLKSLHAETGWHETILKPCVAGSARHTYRLTSETLDSHEEVFQKLIAHEAMILQPFQKNIVSQGEVSIMVMGGTYTHAVVKRARPGDFRVQDNYGGTFTLHTPSKEEIRFAERAVNACPGTPAYARVDLIRDNSNEIALIEIELIEPELWFREYPNAATVLAAHLSAIQL